MAEFVAQSVAKIKNELEAVPFLTLDEKRKILRKHERLEYRLRKRQRQETDYLLYIQYCKDVLQFFKMRKKMRAIQSRAEVPVIKRIHQLYQLCETRFPQSKDVWLQHIEFCKKQKEFGRVGRLFRQMLSTHSTEPELWVESAQWEMEQSNMEGARSLMQRCVAANKTSVFAWAEYYRLELELTKSMREKEPEIDDSNPTHTGKIAQLVSKHALLQCPENCHLLQSLIEVTDKFPFAHDDGGEMLKQLKEKFSDIPSVRDFIARRVLRKKKKKTTASQLLEKQEQRFFSAYEEAVSDIPTSEMWTLYLKAGMEVLSVPTPDNDRLHKRLERVLEMFQRAADLHCLTEDMFLHWLTLLRQGGDGDKETAAKIGAVCEAMVQRFPLSCQAWRQRLGLLCMSLAPTRDVLDCVRQAADVLPETEMWSVWEPALLYVSATNLQNLESIIEKPCYSQSEHLGSPARLFYLRWTAVNKGIKATRNVFNRWYAVKPVSVKFYLEYVKQELMEDKVDMKRVRRAFEHAITDHGHTDPEVWLQYMKVETTYGDPLLSGPLGTRALLNLPQGPLQEHFFMRRAGLTSQ